jgi:hypothetical protein
MRYHRGVAKSDLDSLSDSVSSDERDVLLTITFFTAIFGAERYENCVSGNTLSVSQYSSFPTLHYKQQTRQTLQKQHSHTLRDLSEARYPRQLQPYKTI